MMAMDTTTNTMSARTGETGGGVGKGESTEMVLCKIVTVKGGRDRRVCVCAGTQVHDAVCNRN